MGTKLSAGILLYKTLPGNRIEIMIVHMGGPFWAKKDAGGWSIPKGEYEDGDEPLEVARREFSEEIGQEVPPGELIDLGEVKQSSGKRIRAWALSADIDVSTITSNTFEMEWPPRSGRIQKFPEVDRAAWFDVATARTKLVKGQVPLIDMLVKSLGLPINVSQQTGSISVPERTEDKKQTTLFDL